MRLRYVLGLLLLIPLADALLLVVVAGYIGAPATIALVVLTALVGMLLVRAEGRHTLRRLQRKAARGEPPTDELMDGALLIAAGAFLLTPGLVTDAIGILISIPITRYPIREVLKRYVVVPYLDREMDGFVTGGVWTHGFPDPDEFEGSQFGGSQFDGSQFGGTDGPGTDETGAGVGFGRERFDEEFGGFDADDRRDTADGNDVVDVDFEVDRDDETEENDDTEDDDARDVPRR
ncbi:phage T7 F exclusion suppressor FxsA [Halalkaliarchaeum desulfuricum]|uniref:Phage T7 F exclusion suppressor FxsA n=1 Tax=Halalkaliarchaeum desulfuricum TaxID=2055893 RepID=A0A343TIE4_9EURY|nr:FxsA family protein [Halalkaliarchaeum desulfuricum]AUX08866.1 phage T7 F exclusion suppressor FxsA [Halalkaliarchaeum desulfuricum]